MLGGFRTWASGFDSTRAERSSTAASYKLLSKARNFAGIPSKTKSRCLLYGLCQSALLWYNDLKDSLNVLGFAPIEADQCVFVHPDDDHIIIVYVDHLLLITKDKTSMTGLKRNSFTTTSVTILDLWVSI
ncbi:uncharacterized protein K460DRAFT_396223 [Cucurbitaria berberidis CBS 394.84]|uniref:Reverse transcriptase Ty1/copia-type domain-containing protein n=1 Tax=Cucurbitaria berberidis CBS 394.84 TaxID=1168544 RepID=A0A9P4GBE6_9PLEO|nr:uncharacterized protein K460DRAFT_396223 [Cucurbitaria berberidis CBS 394.84]KAF1842728.1 hypothetical protein K460DRAFT_396223 [Cucurbitaria berberidis CBS 394.84]